MYPLPVILVGIEEAHLPAVRQELARAAVDVESEFPSPGAAFEGLRGSKTKIRLLIMQLGAECDADAIRRIGEHLGRWPVLALLPGQTSLQEALRVNRAGASQVVQLPLDRDEFRLALRLIASQHGQGLHDHQVLAVAGATGGSGATMIAINLAAELASRFRRPAILAELSLQVGALASMLDVHPRVTLPHLLREIHRVDDLLIEKALVPVVEGLKVLGGPDHISPLTPVEPAHLARIIGYLKKLADVTVLDVPSAFHAPDSEVLLTADHVILVGLQNIHSIRSLKLYCEMFPEDRVNHSLTVVINRYHPEWKRFTAEEIKQLLGTPRLQTIANDFRSVSLAINQGRPLRQAAPQTPILRDLDSLIHALLGLERPKSERAGNGLFGRVFRASKG